MVTAQFALYPLRSTHVTPVLEQALAAARSVGLTIETERMSSMIEGSEEQVFAALLAAFSAAAASGDTVLVATISNACPIA